MYMKKIYIQKDSYSKRNIPEFLNYLENLLKFSFIITNSFNEAEIIIFKNFSQSNYKNYIKNINKSYYCYIYEPLSDKNYINYIKKLKNYEKINIITYSLSNIKIIKNYITDNRLILFLPMNYLTLNKINNNKCLDIGILYRDNDYNNKIFNKSIIDINKIHTLNCYGKDKDIFFSKLKIFINLHKSIKSKILETFRIYDLIMHKVIIISQKCIYSDEDPISKYIIFEEDNNLYNKSYEVLNNYNEYYENIYGEKSMEKIFDFLIINEKKIINHIF